MTEEPTTGLPSPSACVKRRRAYNLGGYEFPAAVVRFLDKKAKPTPNYTTLEEVGQAFYKESVPGQEKKTRGPGLRRGAEYSLFSRADYARTYDEGDIP